MGFISTKAHTVIGIIVGVLLILAPMLFGFANYGGAAVWIPQVVGVVVILSELITTSEWSPVKLVPMSVHVAIDYVIGLFLVISPWLFGFATAAASVWLPHVVVGLLVIGYAAATKVGVTREIHAHS